MKERTKVKRSIGRPRPGMLDELVVVSYGDTKMRADNRREWRSWLPCTCREAVHERRRILIF